MSGLWSRQGSVATRAVSLLEDDEEKVDGRVRREMFVEDGAERAVRSWIRRSQNGNDASVMVMVW